MMTVAMLAVAQPVAAQSLFSARGLGTPVPAVDARARALGGIGLGLLGLNTSLVNPAELAGVGRRGVAAVLQPVSGTVRFDGAEDDFTGTRFPLMRLTYPIGRGMVLAGGFGSVFDQSWAVARAGTVVLGGETVPVTDVIGSTGGIAQGTVGLGIAIAPWFALGVAGGVYTGNVDREIQRFFDDPTFTLQPFEARARWDYSGPFVTVGASYDPDPALRVGLSMTASGDLRARIVEGEGEDARFRMPLRISAGASGLLSAELLAAVAVERAGEVTAIEGGSGIAGRSTWRVGGGLELEAIRTPTRTYPLRVGASWAQLPFADAGETAPTEWALALGGGFRLAGDQLSPFAVIDATVERGGRSGLVSDSFADGLSESFWRLTFSLSVFGR